MASEARAARNFGLIRWLTYLMFMMFAMTSDAVGSIIPTVIKEYHLSLTAAGTFHYVPMAAIALGAIALGAIADKMGRKRAIIIGLTLYGVGSAAFAAGNSFEYFVLLLAISGLGISVFKTGALALIGDISTTGTEHSSMMNAVEGFFAVGSIIGPAIVAVLLEAGMSWKWLYVIAGATCAALIVLALLVRYPSAQSAAKSPPSLTSTMRIARDPYALAFSAMIMLYVAVEVAIYVWMPTYLETYRGPIAWLPAYALTIFFVLRAAGRFVGIWLVRRFPWQWIMALFAAAIVTCFLGSLIGGTAAGVFLLPGSGLFMSMIYPTLNSKGISGFDKSDHGAAAGVILFFTALSAALGPLAMAAVSDAFGSVKYGFVLATGFAFLLFACLLVNLILYPRNARLRRLDEAVAAQQGFAS